MALIVWSSSPSRSPERDNFGELLRQEDNVADIKKFASELNLLKNDIQINNKSLGDSAEALLLNLDTKADQMFDGRALHNRQNIEEWLKKDDIESIRLSFNKDYLPTLMAYIDEIKSREIQELTDYDYFQLNELSFAVLKNSIIWSNNNTETTPGVAPRDHNPDMRWDKKETWRNLPGREPFHEFIDKDPRNRSYQALSPLTWNEDIDRNWNGIVNNRELRKAWVIDRYRQSDRDVRQAVQKIINRSETEFKKKDVRWVNRQDLTSILTEVMQDYYIHNTDIRDRKAFRKYFRETFIKTDIYKKTGIGARRDMNRILDILEAWLGDPTVQEALDHLADMWRNARNINIVWASNDLELLTSGAVNKKNLFLFLCDFDSDWTVNSTNITKQKPNHTRRDTGSVMGLQLYQNFASYANLDANNSIIDGPRTAILIKNIIVGVQSKSDQNSNLYQSLNKYITAESNKWEQSWFSIQSFLQLMTGEYNIGGKKLNVIWTTAIKSYLESLANESNEWSWDVSDIFVSKQDRAAKLKENAETAPDVSRIYQTIDRSLAAWGHDYGEAELSFTRRTIADKVLQFVNYFTDTLYVNMDNDGKLASIFHWEATPSAIWAIRQKFYLPDGTRNEQLIKDELDQYIHKKIIPSFGVAVDASGNPIIGVGIGTNNLSEDLSKRFTFNFNIGATLPVFNWTWWQIPSDFRIGINIDIERTRQTKNSKKETKKQNRKDLVPTTRVWLAVGAGYEFVTQQIYLRAGPVWDRDFPSGIEQKWREFDYLLTSILDPSEHNFANWQDYANTLKQKIARLADKNDRIADNKRFLDDIADALWQKMERAGVFDILNSPEYKNNIAKKTNLLNFFYNQFIDAFHENAINQDLYNQLSRQGVKVTKINIWALVGTSVTAIALAPVTGWLSLAALGIAWSAGVRLSTFRNSFVADRYNTRANYEKIQTHKNMDAAPEFTTLEEAARHLEQQLNVLEPGVSNIIKVTPDEDTGTFRIWLNPKWLQERNIHANSILSYLNIYHSPDAAQWFRFENGELILGQADVHIGRLVKRDRVEFHVMLWSDVNKMTKLTGNTNTDTAVTWYEKTPESPRDLTKEMVTWLVDGLSDVWDKEALINLIWDKCKVLSPAATRGDIIVKNYPDGSQKVEYKRDESSDTLTLRYEIIAETGKKEWKEFSGPYVKEINLGAAFDYVIDNPNSYEKLRIDLDTLGKNHSRDLFNTADTARRSNPDLLLAFLSPLSTLDYTKASTALLAVLEKKKIPAYDPFIAKLKNPSLPKEELILLCNKFRHLLAYNATSIKLLTGSWYSNINKLWWLMMSRQNAYEAMAGRNNVPDMFRKNGRYYKELYNKTKDRSGYELADAPHISGYTAFYRTSEKHFGVAHPGETKLVKNGNETAKVDVEKEDITQTADRYFANLEKNPEEFAIIQKTINDQLKAADVHLRIRTVEDLKKLILGKTVSYENKEKTKKEILTFDSKFVFYLMWECTNESIGLEFGKVKIRKDNMEEWEIIDENKTQTTTIHPGKKPPVYKTSRRNWTYNNEYDIQTRQRDLTIAWSVQAKLKDKPPVDGWTPDRWSDPIDGWGADREWTTPGDGWGADREWW
jgi:hypothetical protein